MIKAIFAMDDCCGIGKDGALPWPKNTEDLKFFKNKTSGHIVVMGTKTWDDPCFPSPLPNRENYVVSSSDRIFDGATKISIEEIMDIEKATDKIVWIIGGANLLKQCFHFIEEIHVTSIPGDYNCDTFISFPLNKFTLVDKQTGINNYYHYKKIE